MYIYNGALTHNYVISLIKICTRVSAIINNSADVYVLLLNT